MKITDKYIFFWKEFLSNWYRCDIEWAGRTWRTSEHVFMAMKARLFNDDKSFEDIHKSIHPRDAQSFGRLVSDFNQAKWDKNKYNFMLEANRLKFEQNTGLLQKLLNLYNPGQEFVEASPYDKVWGIGMDENHPTVHDSSTWKGENLLGKVLTNIAKIYA